MPDLTNSQRQTLALAGVFQAAYLVHNQATSGLLDSNALATSLGSILVTDPETTAAIYANDLSNLKTGAATLRKTLNKDPSLHPNILRYAMSLLLLNTKLAKNTAMLTSLGQRLDIIKSQALHFAADNTQPATHENIIGACASLYQDTLSTLSFRIQVQGDPNLLQQSRNADKIRALLLAGIRSAMLWSQAGGKRWRLLFARKRILQDLHDLAL